MFKYSKIISVIIIFLVVFLPIEALASSQQDIQNQINNNKTEINNIENQKSNIKTEKKLLEGDLQGIIDQITVKGSELTNIENKLSSLNSNIKEKEQSLNNLNVEIAKTKKTIDTKEKEIKDKEAEQKKASDLLGKRLRSLYMSNQTDAFIEYVFESKSIVDLIDRFDTINIVYKHDSDIIKSIRKLQLELENTKTLLEQDKKSIEAKKLLVESDMTDLNNTKSQLVTEKKNYKEKLSELQAIENQKQSTIASLSEKDRELQNKIGELTSYNDDLENQLKQLLNQVNNPGNNSGGNTGNNPPPNSSNFLRPVPGPITSTFGPRTDPEGFHKGLDFGPSYGTPIKAAKSGTIAISQYSSSFGYFVVINHGNGMQTLYAHASSLNCSVGQQVQQGQVIAYVGSTGWSTGPHLHFEVRINGEAVNPQNYIPN